MIDSLRAKSSPQRGAPRVRALAICVVLIGLCMALVMGGGIVLAAPPAVACSPAAGTHGIGEPFDVDVAIAGVTDLGFVDMQVSFDPAILQVVDADPGTPGVQVQPGPIFPPPPSSLIASSVDNAAGTVNYSALSTTAFSGDGAIVTITFSGVITGSSVVTITSLLLQDSVGNVIDATTAPGVYTITVGSTPTPTATASETPTATATETSTPNLTVTATETATQTPAGTIAPPTATATQTPAGTIAPPTATATQTPAGTITPPTATPTLTATATQTPFVGTAYVWLPLLFRDLNIPTPTPTITNTPSPTLTPAPSNTPSQTPTPAPTNTFTPAPTPTGTITPTPTLAPGQCRQLIVNGNAETNEGWIFPVTAYTAGYSTQHVRSGTRALRTGIEFGSPVYSYSSAKQFINIPLEAQSLTLSWWYYTVATGSQDDHDKDYVLLIDQYGAYHYLKNLSYPATNANSWAYAQFTGSTPFLDGTTLNQFRGQRVQLLFETVNNSWGGRAVMYTDDVNLVVCR